MQQPSPICITLIHYLNGHITFSCLSLPHFSFSTYFHYLPAFLFILSNLVLIILLFVVLKWLYLLKKSLQEKYVLLSITPPSATKQTTFTTEQFYTSLHALSQQKSFIDTLLRRKNLISLELASTKEDGIRYILRVPQHNASVLKRQLTSFLPGVAIATIADYLPEKRSINSQSWSMTEVTLSHDFYFPLQEQKLLSQYDPIAYFTGQMTQLASDELILLQLVITPLTQKTHGKKMKLIHQMKYDISQGYDALARAKYTHSLFITIVQNFCLLLAFIPLSLVTIPMYFLSNSTNGDFLPFWLFRRNEKKIPLTLPPEKQVIQQLVGEKIKKELFEVSIRFFVIQEKKQNREERTSGFLSSLQPLQTHLQSFHTKRFSLIKPFHYFKLKNRLLSLNSNVILSVSELANLFHLPYTPTTQTEDLMQSKYQEFAVPLSVKKNLPNFSLTFAKNSYAERETPIGLTNEERKKHVYVIGATMMGKSTLLQTMILEDIQKGNGLSVIDPHGDLIEAIIDTIPQERYEDVILFDPDDTDFPFGLNILALPENLTEEKLEKYKDHLTSSVISLFAKLFPLKNNAHRMEHILRHTVLTALETENPTLFTIQKILTDYQYRKQVVESLKDPILIHFWKKEFNSIGNWQRTEMIAPITNRLGIFLTTHTSRNILLQKTSSFSFTQIMNEKKILLCNLSKGKLGEDMSAFFGALLTAQIQLASLERIRIPEEDRTDFYLYIDEFQNFATPSFGQIMSEARKFKLYAILAHQTTAQITDKSLVDIILANTGTIISFRTGSPLDEQYVLPFFSPEVQEGQLLNLPPHHFYIKITDSTPQNPFTGETYKKVRKIDEQSIAVIRELSQQKYGRKEEIVEKDIQDMFTETTPPQQRDEKREMQKAQNALLKKSKNIRKKD